MSGRAFAVAWFAVGIAVYVFARPLLNQISNDGDGPQWDANGLVWRGFWIAVWPLPLVLRLADVYAGWRSR